ncbi:putative chloramphenical resistance permease RarD [Arcanobacterium haemolyticum]|uniref:EamA family transporter RarD n=1 Tax=Arcanobacterium haemolyticum TaxID=28264 RepID=UPI000D967F9E|nr:EamA family transporter RarD [Arcanobacterium haemolyticum]SPT74715.1 putative chloramphenical resistance permease RarD [Arcanobacterium haemolyticum]
MSNRGVVISLLSSVAFAMFSYIAALTEPLTGVELWAWRMVMTVPGVLLVLLITKRFSWFTGEWDRVRSDPKKLIAYAFCAPMLAGQMWLFGWAPQVGRTLEVGMGYFLMPLVMVVIGRVFYKERMTSLMMVATVIAACAVAYEAWRAGGIGWVASFIALGYPAYFVVRRYFETDGVGALAWEMALALPVSLWVAAGSHSIQSAFSSVSLVLILLSLGALSVLGVITYVLAVKWLSYGMFGLLSYVEPVLVIIVAILLGERIDPTQWWTYVGIWLSVFLLGVDGVIALSKRVRWSVPAVRPWRRRRPRHPRTEPDSWARFFRTRKGELVEKPR